ncbi:MAG: MFS transporter [Spirochaetales bacterium]|nr:MFS transporter [Spirochaetales bacterium]
MIKQVLRPYSSLPFQVYILFLARIINRMGDFVGFFLTLYLSRFLGFSEKETGLVVSLAGLSMMAGSLLGGRLSDRRGRKKLLILFQTLSALTVIACGFLPDSLLIVPLLITFILFNGAARPINSALVTDITTKEERPAAFSLLYLGINIGVAVGPLIAGFLFNSHRKWLFLGDGISTLFSLILIICFIKEPERKSPQENLIRQNKESSLKILKGLPLLALFFPLSVGASFLYSQHAFAIPLQLQALFSQESSRIFGKIMSLNALTVLLITPFITHAFPRRSALQKIALAQIFYGVGFGLLIIPAAHPGLFYLSTLFWTTGEVLDAVNGGVFVANHSPSTHRGRFSSLFIITKGAGRSLAPLIGGVVMGRWGTTVLWSITLFMGIVLFSLMTRLSRKDRSAQSEGQLAS